MRQIISTFAIAGIALMASCTTTADRVREAKMAEQEKELQELKTQIATQRAIDSVTELAKLNGQQYPIAGEVSKTRTTRRSSTRSSSASANSSGSYAGNSSTAPVYTPAPEKKGWSAKAKGAVIGGVGGAAAGAIINKRNRAAGAVIGGVLGAGAGTGIGAVIDKKNGR